MEGLHPAADAGEAIATKTDEVWSEERENRRQAAAKRRFLPSSTRQRNRQACVSAGSHARLRWNMARKQRTLVTSERLGNEDETPGH